MGVLEQVQQMKNQGIGEQEIIKELQQQGISPKAINDAMNQSQIKSAVSDEYNSEEYQPSITKQQSSPKIQTIDQSKRNLAPMQYPNPEIPAPQENYSQEYAPENPYYPEQYSQENYPYENSPEGGYSDYQEYPAETNYTDTIIEVSDQVFSEKIKKFQKQIEDLNEFKALAETKIEYLEKSLKRIESILDKLQIAILEKIGNYGKNLNFIKKEMSMMQDSFKKAISKPKKLSTKKRK